MLVIANSINLFSICEPPNLLWFGGFFVGISTKRLRHIYHECKKKGGEAL